MVRTSRQKQEDLKFEASPGKVTETYLKTKQNKTKPNKTKGLMV
jgi:hypothetical protein